jgi:high frequency lysogenization protein
MPLQSIHNQTIALAGLSQACWLVNQLATTGLSDSRAIDASLTSLLKIDADSVLDVYGGLGGIKQGLLQLDQQLSSKALSSPEQVRYAGQLVHLQKQLANRPEMQKTIYDGMIRAQAQAEHYGILHENVLANFADIYHQTISTLQPRIMVIGDQQYLSSPFTINKIRSVLLAGIRSAQLWRQCGGSRWKLIFARSKLQAETRFLLSKL